MKTVSFVGGNAWLNRRLFCHNSTAQTREKFQKSPAEIANEWSGIWLNKQTEKWVLLLRNAQAIIHRCEFDANSDIGEEKLCVKQVNVRVGAHENTNRETVQFIHVATFSGSVPTRNCLKRCRYRKSSNKPPGAYFFNPSKMGKILNLWT